MTEERKITGGCQCGAVRYAASSLGRASICHCRMCQKAFGSFFGPLVTAHALIWTRGEPKRFESSNLVRRGFCGECGTPLTYECAGEVEISIGSLDDVSVGAPVIEVNPENKVSFFAHLASLPDREPAEILASVEFQKRIINHQHPDRDTDQWPPKERQS
ncbi:MAG: GFA family protein [Phyllobacterium sp.]